MIFALLGITLCYRCHKKEHEKLRPVRIRSNLPQRRTLQKRIKQLETENQKLRENLALANSPKSRAEYVGRGWPLKTSEGVIL